MLEEALQRLRQAAECRAAALLGSGELRDMLDQVLRGSTHDSIAIARSVTPILVARSDVPLIPALFAAIAIRIARFDSAGAAGVTTQEQD
jgi:hypothetical protein